MKINKLMTTTAAAALILSGAAYAQDFSFDSSDFGSDDFGFGSDSSSSSPVEISGDVDANARGYISGKDEAQNTPVTAEIDADLKVKYSGSKADAEVDLNLNTASLQEHPEDVIDEAYVTGYMGNFKIEAGKMKTVWGKGDKLHVIDNFNSDDYTDFIIPDYLDRRIATPMLKASVSPDFSGKLLSNVKLEGVYTPFLPVDRFASSGRWTPAQVSSLTSTVKTGATDKVAKAFTDYTTATTETGAIIGALSTMEADVTAAKTAYDTANSGYNQATTAMNNINTVYSSTPQIIYQNTYQTAIANGADAATAASTAQTAAANATDDQKKSAYAAYMKSLDSSYNSTYDQDVAKATAAQATAKDAIAATSYDYQEANGVYTAALKKYGYTTLEDAKTKLKADLTSKGTNYMTTLTMANALNADSSIIYPDTNTLKYGQAGARLTYSVGPVDLGMSYYYGHYKQPSVNYDKLDSYLTKYLSNQTITEDDKFLAYDQKQTFGIEAATILWHFNLRGEGCYNLTTDTEGTNPWVHNNSVQWLGGFDVDLPLWNMNLNLQETGSYIMNNDKITGSTNETKDVDYNKNGYTSNKIVGNLTASLDNDKVLPEVSVVYCIESGDLVVLPKLVIKPTSELSLGASGMYIWTKDDNSQFAAWNKNNFVQLSAALSF